MQKKQNIKKEYVASLASCLSTNCRSSTTNNANICTCKTTSSPLMYYSMIPVNNNLQKLQSPKVTSLQKRSTPQPKLFSLIDINDKITHKKSTDLPAQYKRRSVEEIKRLLNQTTQPFYEKIKTNLTYRPYIGKNHKRHKEFNYSMLQKKSDNCTTSCVNNYYTEDVSENNNSTNLINANTKMNSNINTNNNNSICDQNTSTHIDNTLNTIHIKNHNSNYKGRKTQTAIPPSRSKRLYKPYIFEYRDYQKFENKIPHDKFKPRDYEYCEELIKKAAINQYKPISKQHIMDSLRSKSSNTKNDNNSLLDKSLPLLIHKELKQQSFESDIFFQKQSQQEQQHHQQQQVQAKISSYNSKGLRSKSTNSIVKPFQQSDIFLLKNDDVSINKSGEKNFFKIKPQFKYTASRESNSMWHPKNIMPALLNYSSSEYHILNPSIKNISQTKHQIKEQYKEMNNSNNVGHKQKGLAEFIDVSRVSAPHSNKDYLEIYSKNKGAFAKRNDICSEYYDIYGQGYSKFCDKPFQKHQPLPDEL